MIKIHHLNNSRSQRILWLLEELGTPYEIVKYQRGTPMPFAPPELKAVHPLGKSPVIEDNGVTIAESGAIVEYLIDTHGKGKFKPKAGTAEYWKYIEWLHFAEGSAMLPLMLALYTAPFGDGVAMLKPRIDSEIANHLSFMDNALGSNDFFVGNTLTGADFMLIFVCEAAGARLEPYKNLVRYRAAIHARPAYKRTIEKGGEYGLMSR
jgi:glutathione S-transferase